MMMLSLIFAVVFLSRNCLTQSQNQPFVGQYQRTLGNGYELQWTVKDSMITIKIRAPAKGWIGFGLSPSGTMAFADIVMAGVDQTGTGYLLDTLSLSNSAPIADPRQDWNGIQFSQVNGYTTVIVSRALITRDPFDRDFQKGTLNVIWAYNAEKDFTNNIPMHYHSFSTRGLQKIELIPSTPITATKEMNMMVTPLPNAPTPTVPSQTIYNTSFTDDMTLEWQYTDETITFEVSAPTNGWVGIGFSPGTSMVNADLIVVGKNGDGSSYVYDAFSTWNGPPGTSEQQDVTLEMVINEDGMTKATFYRKRKTGDAKDLDVATGTMNVLWAYGTRDVISSGSYLVTYHKRRGHKVVDLMLK